MSSCPRTSSSSAKTFSWISGCLVRKYKHQIITVGEKKFILKFLPFLRLVYQFLNWDHFQRSILFTIFFSLLCFTQRFVLIGKCTYLVASKINCSQPSFQWSTFADKTSHCHLFNQWVVSQFKLSPTRSSIKPLETAYGKSYGNPLIVQHLVLSSHSAKSHLKVNV